MEDNEIPRIPKSPRPLSEVTPQWTQNDDDQAREAMNPLAAFKTLVWALLLSLVLMGALALFVKVGMLLIGWVTS